MADSFLKNNQNQAPAGGFVSAAPPQPQQQFNQGNPYPPAPGQYGYDPRYAMTADMIYREMGYRDGNPTEIDIFTDLIKGAAPVERFLVGDGWADGNGLAILAHFFSKLLDYKLVSFFKDFKLAIVQDEAGAMFIAPAPEQDTERGKELALTTIAEVSAEMSMIQANLRTNLLDAAERKLVSHREASKIIAQQGGISQLLEEATGNNGQKGGGGVLSGLANFGLRTMGVPVPPAQTGMPPPPPGR